MRFGSRPILFIVRLCSPQQHKKSTAGAPPLVKVRVGGRDGHRGEVGTHPLGTTDLRLIIRKEPLSYREARREWRASVLLPAECPLAGTRVGLPVRKDIVCVLGDGIPACASSPFDVVRSVTGWSHPYQRRSSPSHW